MATRIVIQIKGGFDHFVQLSNARPELIRTGLTPMISANIAKRLHPIDS